MLIASPTREAKISSKCKPTCNNKPSVNNPNSPPKTDHQKYILLSPLSSPSSLFPFLPSRTSLTPPLSLPLSLVFPCRRTVAICKRQRTQPRPATDGILYELATRGTQPARPFCPRPGRRLDPREKRESALSSRDGHRHERAGSSTS